MTLGTVAVLARLLPPEAFGVIAAVAAVTLIANAIGNFGLGPALIRAPEIDDAMLSCAFWANLALSLALAGALAAAAGPIAALFQEPAVVAPLRVASLIVPLTAISVVHRAMLERALAFREVTMADTAGTVLGSIVGIASALAGAGVWALVIQLFGQACGTTAVFLLATRWRPRALLALREHRRMFRFGGYLTLSDLSFLLARQASRPIVSRWLGLEALGLYSVAAQMVVYPMRHIVAILQRIILPVFSRVQDDTARLRHIHLTVTHGICLIVAPMIVLMTMLSTELVALVLGPGWEPVAGLLVYLAIAGGVQSVGGSNRTLLVARNRAGLTFRLNATAAALVVLAQLVGVRFGLEAVAMAEAAAVIAVEAVFWSVGFRLIGQSLARVGAALAPPLASAALMALTVHLVRPLAGPSPIAAILLCGTAGMACYVAAEAILDRGRFGVVVSALVGQVRSRA